MKKFSSILVIALGLTLAGAGCGLTTKVSTTNTTNTVAVNVNTTANVNAVTNTSSTVPAGIIVKERHSYAGQDGKNALELLQAKFTVTEKDGFVSAINGVSQADGYYWSYYVDNKLAEVGAKDYQTKNAETIEWRLEKWPS